MQKLVLLIISSVLFLSCSRSQLVTSTYTSDTYSDSGEISDWIISNAQRNSFDGLVYYVANDDDYLYIHAEINNTSFARDANRYGFTIFMDQDFRRSFGITYPTGLLHALSDYPGARKGFLENPGWGNVPQNRRIIESVERSMHDYALLTQRRERRSTIRPITIPVSHLTAQGIVLKLDDAGRRPAVTMRVPLQTSRNQQFAIDAKKGDRIRLGFEVTPPTPEDIENEDAGLSRRDPYHQNQHQQQRQGSQQNLSQALRGGFEYWTNVKISDTK